jgi:hypothetical protein
MDIGFGLPFAEQFNRSPSSLMNSIFEGGSSVKEISPSS